ncbi:spore coat U domain-containing protein [Methylibium petroleiphilum]|uniref:Csu type fimbrial protein n=1 Tax=Methylibium petroleiphilum TaxID=105560 RepID=UPI001ACD8A20|nr:spore coat U domain-containing protein [Methylibium petroleiphilum]MBN9206916.1 spore coat protein U domain-containing protein [Methylibium petroleiphilum]
MKFPVHHLIAAAALLAVAAPATAAGTATGSFQVQATVASACTVSGSLLNFGGSIDPLVSAVPIDASSTLTVRCTNTTPYTVALDAGIHAGGAAVFGNRNMSNGAQTIGYQLYLDAGRATVWGNGTASSSTVPGTGTGSNQSLTIYGRLPSLTGVVPGSYSDTVTVTISY